MKKNKLIGLGALALSLSLSGCDLLFGCNHKWEPWEILEDPTCMDRGFKERECSLCGVTQSKGVRTDKVNGHNFSENPAADRDATCTTPGITGSMICDYCGQKKAGTETGYSGHRLTVLDPQPTDAKYHSATCNDSGLIAKECSTCHEIVDETVSSLGHEIVADEVKQGPVTTLKCSRCSDIYGYELSIADATGWNSATEKMNGKTSPSNTSTWEVNGIIPADTYDVELEAKLTDSSHSVRKFYNMANTSLTVNGDSDNNTGENADKTTESAYRYTIKVDGKEFTPQTKESWDGLGLSAESSNFVQFVDGVEIGDSSSKVSLFHGNIGYSLICSKIRLVRHIHDYHEVNVEGGNGKVPYKMQTCDCGYTKITIDATKGTFGEGQSNKDGVLDGYVKLASNGNSINYTFDLTDNLVGNVYLVGRQDNYPANSVQNPYNFTMKNGDDEIAFADSSLSCNDIFGDAADEKVDGYSEEAALLVGETTLDAYTPISLTYVRNGSYNLAVSQIVFEGRSAGHIHHYENVPSKNKAATCQSDAINYMACSCGANKWETVSATKTPHTYGKWEDVIEATCTEAGTQARTCTGCKNKLTRSIPATGHDGEPGEMCGTCGEIIPAEE